VTGNERQRRKAEIVVAALREVGFAAFVGEDGNVRHADIKGHDPRLAYRAACLARRVVGEGEPEKSWEEWCANQRGHGPGERAWLDHWGCP
jgi:hypothetical protein